MWHLIVSIPDLCTLTYFGTFQQLSIMILWILAECVIFVMCNYVTHAPSIQVMLHCNKCVDSLGY